MRNLVAQHKIAGVHTISWDGKDNKGAKVSSSVYLYHFKAGNFSNTKKMILMK
ncbi:hypothetical protein H8E88_35140 [candidate division KSB1 bacterium]|nr:hypothetical protein [candidate division KSB1 bacterium]